MLGVPPNGGVDEQDHLVRAAATVRGDIDGTGLTRPDDPVRVYDVPIEFKGPINFCWARHPEQDASCMGFQYPPDERPFAYNGYYPPTYFALVGWPSLLVHGFNAVRPIRLVSLMLSLALIVWSLVSVKRRWGESAALVLGSAITPMTLFLSATVNPQGLELSSALAVWVGATLLLDPSPGMALRRSDRALLVVGGLTLVTTRPLGTVFWVVALVVVALSWGMVNPLRWVRRREIVGVTATAMLVAAILAWRGTATIENGTYAHDVGIAEVAGRAVVDAYRYLLDAVGRIGWLEIPPPTPVVIIWTLLMAAGVWAILLRGSRARRWALAALAAAYFVIQVGISWSQVNLNGLNWQGRYGLPLLIGVPVLAVPIVKARVDARAGAAVVASVGVGLFASFYMALRRWTVGTNGPIWYAFSARWVPPLPAWMVVATAAVGALLVATAGVSRQAPK